MLVEEMKEPCVLMEKTRHSDGEGGWVTTWVESVEFRAAIGKNQDMLAKIAEKQGVTSVYTVTTDINAGLDFHDVFKRLSDGQIFRVTSDSRDSQTPKMASFKFATVTAEEWSLVEN